MAAVVRVLHPDAIAEGYRRKLIGRVNATHAILTKRLAVALARVGPDINARAAEKRGDSVRSDLEALIRVVAEVERAIGSTMSPDVDGLEATAARVGTFATAQQRAALKTVAGIDITGGQPALLKLYSSWARENASLITSIDERYFDDIRDKIVEAVRSGQTTRSLAADLAERYSVSKSRAELIARDQIATLNGQITEKRQTGLGIKKYKWVTSHDNRVRGDPGGLYPDADPSHYERDGEVFSWDSPPEGGHPGIAINCFPGDARVRCFDRPRTVYRRHYVGPMVRFALADGTDLRLTPNHPILTADGWAPAGEVRAADALATCPPGGGMTLDAVEWFAWADALFGHTTEPGAAADFHGDGRMGRGADVVRTTPGAPADHAMPTADELATMPAAARAAIGTGSVLVLAARVEEFSGYVYNLETAAGWYVANGVIQKNCRCGAVPQTDDEEFNAPPNIVYKSYGGYSPDQSAGATASSASKSSASTRTTKGTAGGDLVTVSTGGTAETEYTIPARE